MTRWRLSLGLLAVLAVIAAAFATESNIQVPEEVRRATGIESQHARPASPLDEIIYFEDWETGDLNGWTASDLTATPSPWHRDDYNAFGGTGMSWWMGDSTVGANGGYEDDWYMVLDSPPVTLGATPSLSFWHRWAVEDPAGAESVEGYPPNTFNGWDGVNIRISVDGGQTWTVIPGNVITPTYTRSSLYSFGHQHEEGPGIPGWCDDAAAGQQWQVATANLTQWANQSVKIRWAFASDPAYSTPNNPALFGWMVDNIRVYNGANDTTFSSDANADDGFTHMSMAGAPAGNLWRIATDNSSPAGPHILVCNDQADNEYNPDMSNILISPLIDCRDLENGILMADFQITGLLPTCSAFPDCDYWGIQVSTDSGASWCYGSNPTCDPNGDNYVYTDAPPTWAAFNESYGVALDMSALIGNVLQFKFTFESNADNQEEVGPKFDGFQLDHQAGFPNDVSCYTLQVRYPNIVGRPTRIKAYFDNTGQEPQSFPAWFRVNNNAQQRFLPNVTLDPGVTAVRDTVINFTAANTYTVRAWSALAIDENLQNDTSTVAGVVVHPAGTDLELGYDNRTIQYRFNYATGQGALVHFTPWTDGVVSAAYDVTQIRAHFDAGQPADLPFQLHVYLGGGAAPGTEVLDQAVTVLTSETGEAIWKDINVTDPDLQNITQDFWVWFEVTNTDPNDRYPQVLGDDEQPWDDVHNYVWPGTGNPTESAFFYQIHAVIDAGTPAGDLPAELPLVWNLEQNYPNPFNPATEIRYTVPNTERMTLKVFNVMGQEVATLVNGLVNAGSYVAAFDATDLPSGVYVYRLESESFTASHKMLLLK